MTSTDYAKSWERRVLDNAPKDETPDDVLSKIREERYINRGRWAAYVVRLGAACRRADA